MVLKRGRNQALGLFGESRVADYRLHQGDEVIERNWRVREGEIDLITLDKGGIFHFIEVKTRSSLSFGHPFEAISPAKLLRMQRLAMGWLVTHDCFGCEYSIDIASILLNPDGTHSLEYRAGVL
jgi:putative endonuclease